MCWGFFNYLNLLKTASTVPSLCVISDSENLRFSFFEKKRFGIKEITREIKIINRNQRTVGSSYFQVRKEPEVLRKEPSHQPASCGQLFQTPLLFGNRIKNRGYIPESGSVRFLRAAVMKPPNHPPVSNNRPAWLCTPM
jgi:hypothetical protein